MIDWYFVATHALWILGLAIVLAAFSYHDWERHEAGRSLREQLARPSFQLALNAGLLLVALSFVLMEGSRWWERVVWAGLGGMFVRSSWAAWGAVRATTAARPPSAAAESEHRADRAPEDGGVEQQ